MLYTDLKWNNTIIYIIFQQKLTNKILKTCYLF